LILKGFPHDRAINTLQYNGLVFALQKEFPAKTRKYIQEQDINENVEDRYDTDLFGPIYTYPFGMPLSPAE
jgi:hypothetical protein